MLGSTIEENRNGPTEPYCVGTTEKAGKHVVK